MKEVKIKIPDNCELVKDGDNYVIKEMKQNPPRSWEEFCERCPKKMGEAFISSTSEIFVYDLPSIRADKRDKNVCSSKEEAEAFLALMQLRQLRKAWVGDWEPYPFKSYSAISTIVNDGKIVVWEFNNTLKPISFPTKEMAEDFLSCFKDLCETAKMLL